MKLGGPVELVGFGPEWQRPGAAPLEEGRGNQGTFSTTGPLSGELGPGSLQFSETWWGGGGQRKRHKPIKIIIAIRTGLAPVTKETQSWGLGLRRLAKAVPLLPTSHPLEQEPSSSFGLDPVGDPV